MKLTSQPVFRFASSPFHDEQGVYTDNWLSQRSIGQCSGLKGLGRKTVPGMERSHTDLGDGVDKVHEVKTDPP